MLLAAQRVTVNLRVTIYISKDDALYSRHTATPFPRGRFGLSRSQPSSSAPVLSSKSTTSTSLDARTADTAGVCSGVPSRHVRPNAILSRPNPSWTSSKLILPCADTVTTDRRSSWCSNGPGRTKWILIGLDRIPDNYYCSTTYNTLAGCSSFPRTTTPRLSSTTSRLPGSATSWDGI